MDEPASIACPAPASSRWLAERLACWASPRYYVCLAILGMAAVGMYASASLFQKYTRKEALPLKRPLHEINVARLLPEYELAPQQPPPLNEEMIATLGTSEYVGRLLVRRDAVRSDPTRLAHVFITYYTGRPDNVPHVPQECVQASGWALASETTAAVTILDKRVPKSSIPLNVCQFAPPDRGKAASDGMPILYFFYTNGVYTTTRTGVRVAQSNLRDRYAYYSKIEISFTGGSGRFPTRDEAVAASQALLAKLWPILLDDHFQDWTAVKSGNVSPAE